MTDPRVSYQVTDVLWTRQDVAKALSVNVRTVATLRIPRITLPGRGKKPIVRYDPAEVQRFIDAHSSKKLRRAG